MFDPTVGLKALGFICAVAFATWLVSLWRRDASIVDGMWPVFIAGASLVYAGSWGDLTTGAGLALTLLLIWAARLCIHITVRNHGQPEDRRYQKIRANNPPFWIRSLYIVFGFQAALSWIVAMPFMVLSSAPADFGVLHATGLAVAAFGILYEGIADWQLESFRKLGGNRGRVLDTGLWRYSRHPNYFGECCVWWGFGIFALGAGAWWALASPLLMTLLLLKVSGVTMLERDIGDRRPQYARYIQQTNAFLPGTPRN
jgi:steroid 5-alpha reductase family enzyme